MVAKSAKDIMLYIGDGASPVESFTVIEGAQVTRMQLQHNTHTLNAISSDAWRELSEGGQVHIDIVAEGVFLNTPAQLQLQQCALAKRMQQFRLVLANADSLQGAFKVTRFERYGEVNAIEQYRFELASGGAVSLN